MVLTKKKSENLKLTQLFEKDLITSEDPENYYKKNLKFKETKKLEAIVITHLLLVTVILTSKNIFLPFYHVSDNSSN